MKPHRMLPPGSRRNRPVGLHAALLCWLILATCGGPESPPGEGSVKPRQNLQQSRSGVGADQLIDAARALLQEASIDPAALAATLERLRGELASWRRLGNADRQIEVLELLCKAHQRAGQADLALAYGEEAVELSRLAKDDYGMAVTSLRLAAIRQGLGQQRRATQILEEALEGSRAADSAQLEVLTLIRLAGAQQRLGELGLALRSFEQGLSLLGEPEVEIGDEAEMRFGYGGLLIALQRPLESGHQFEQAAELYRRAPDGQQQLASVLNRLAHVAYRLGDRKRVEELLAESRALLMAMGEKAPGAQDELALSHLFQARLELDEKNLPRAEEAARRALEMARRSAARKLEGMALLDLGRIRRRLPDAASSLQYCRQALEIFEDLEEPASQALAGIRVAEALLDLGRPQEAWQYIEPGLQIAEAQRIASHRSDVRADYFAFRQDFFEIAIDVLMAKHRIDADGGFHLEALEVHERRRARNLLDTLSAAQGAEPVEEDPQLLAEEGALEAELRRLTRDVAVPDIEDQLVGLLHGLQRVRGELRRRRHPEAAAAPVDLERMLSTLEADDSLVLVYSLGERGGYLWSILGGHVEAYPLQNLWAIEANIDQLAEHLPRTAERSLMATRRAGKALGELLLGPVAKKLGDRRLVVVAPGKLQHIPFGALMRPGSTSEDNYLIRRHEVVMLPSVASLVLMRQQEAGRPIPGGGIFALADPVFGLDDPRLRAPTRDAAPLPGPATEVKRNPVAAPQAAPDPTYLKEALEAQQRSIELLSDRMEFKVNSRLPGSGKEVAGIIDLADELGVKVVSHLGFEASREVLVGADLGELSVLHIASHAFQDQALPELSGLILSLVDEQGRPRNGFLRAFEISRLQLPLELVVLSACETGRGRAQAGEGVLGLSRAFLDAGATRLVTSLWKVDDGSTAELMRHFYAFYLRTGLSPSAALRQAQLVLLDDTSTRAPYHWAGFVFQGEWRAAPKDLSE